MVQFSEVAACNFTKNKLLHRYEAKISEAYSQKLAAFLSLDSCLYSNNWITQLIESI